MNQLREVGLDFLESAPHKFVFEAEVDAPRKDVWAAISADPSTWTEWFPGLDEGGYEGDGPPGVGTLRQIRMGDSRYRETMLAWDEPSRWAYRVDESTDPVAKALVEDWRMEERGDKTVVDWTFAVDPGPQLADAIEVAESVIGDVFRQAMGNLSKRLSPVSRKDSNA